MAAKPTAMSEKTPQRVVEHPTHGNITIPAGFTALIGYQPNWDAAAQRERRNAD